MSLNWLYRASGVLAALCLVAITLIILAQIVGRFYGFVVPSADDFAGYFVSASIFLALAYTLQAGGHIRVTIVIGCLPKPIAYLLELFSVTVGVFITGYFAWYALSMVIESYRFNDVSQGYLKIPLWIPQSPLAFGIIVLFLAFLEDFLRVIVGKPPSYADADSQISSE